MPTVQDAREAIDLEAKIGLLGSEREKQDAIRLLLDTYGTPIMSFLADRFSTLDPADRASALHDALRAVYDGALEIANDDRPFAPFLFEVAKRSAISTLRYSLRHRQPDDEIAAGIAATIIGTKIGLNWNRVRIAGRAEQVQREFRAFVLTLIGQQKRIGSVMADNLPDTLSDSEIAEEASRRAGEPITTMQVKGAKAALVKKFREIMAKKLEQL